MSEVNEILKKVTASIEEATGKFNAKAEEALTEAKKNGKLSAETKETVDKMATEFNALKEAEKTLQNGKTGTLHRVLRSAGIQSPSWIDGENCP